MGRLTEKLGQAVTGKPARAADDKRGQTVPQTTQTDLETILRELLGIRANDPGARIEPVGMAFSRPTENRGGRAPRRTRRSKPCADCSAR